MRLAIVLVAFTTCGLQGIAPPDTQPLWWWFSTCGGPFMTIEVRSQGTTVVKASVPVCQAPRNASSSQGGAGRIDFAFHARQSILWKGYRDESARTIAGQKLEGSLWQAGADPDAVLIGVSFSEDKRVVMNTIHIAHPNQRDESTIATGLTVTTYPTAR